MPTPVPPTIAIALEELRKAFQAVQGPTFDPMTEPWSAIAQATQKLLNGGFQASDPHHRLFQLRLGALFGARLTRENDGFWFRQRDALGNFSVGFPGGVFTVSPFTVTALALVSGTVAGLETAAGELKTAVNASKTPGGAPLTPRDYERFFDPAFLEFFALDRKAAQRTWESAPRKLIAALKDASFRAQPSKTTRDWLEKKLLFALGPLDPERPLIDQAERDLPLVERVGELFAARYGTGLTAEEGWAKAALPLLSVDLSQNPKGEPVQGMGVLAAFLSCMPKLPEVPSEGILGLFSSEQIAAPDPRLSQYAGLRTFRVNPDPLLPLLQRFDGEKLRERVQTFARALGPTVQLTPQETAVVEESLTWLKRLQDTLALAVRDQLDLCLRRAPEIEGYAGDGKARLREALQ